MTTESSESSGRAGPGPRTLAPLAAIGAAAGLALRALLPEEVAFAHPDRIAAAVAVVTLAGSAVLLRPAPRRAAGMAFAACLALLCGALTWQRFHTGAGPQGVIEGFLPGFWMAIGWPLLAFLSLTLAATALHEGRLRWPYPALFAHAVTGPVAAAAGLAGGLAAGLFLFLWSAAFGLLGVQPLKEALESFWVILPVAGAVGAMAAAYTQDEARLRGAADSALQIGARILLPLLAVFSLMFAALLPVTGIEGLGETLSPTGLLLTLALAAMLVFNGVYRDGRAAPGPLLRWSSWLAVATLPVFAGLALYGIGARIGGHGLTPERVIVAVIASLTAAYTLLLLAGLTSELPRWRKAASGWMPPVARLNVRFAAAWVVVLIALNTPLFDPVALSARDQEARLRGGAVSADDFDFAYLQFRLGEPGRRALERIAGWEDHADAAVIGERIAEARAVESYPYRAEAEALAPVALPPELEAELAVIDGLMDDAAADLAAAMLEPAARARAVVCSLEGNAESAEQAAAWAAAQERYGRIDSIASALSWLFDLNSPPGAEVQEVLYADCPADNPD